MRDDNHAAPPLYQAGDFWQAINRDDADLIHAGALRNVRNEYFNRRFAGHTSGPLCAFRHALALLPAFVNIYSFAEMPPCTMAHTTHWEVWCHLTPVGHSPLRGRRARSSYTAGGGGLPLELGM